MRKLLTYLLMFSLFFWSVFNYVSASNWFNNKTYHYISVEKRNKIVDKIMNKLKLKLKDKTYEQKIAYIEKFEKRLGNIKLKLRNLINSGNLSEYKRKLYLDIQLIIYNLEVKVYILKQQIYVEQRQKKEEKIKPIIKYLLQTNNYTEFDKAVLALQQKYIVKTLKSLKASLLKNINNSYSYNIDGNINIKMLFRDLLNIKFKNLLVEKQDDKQHFKWWAYVRFYSFLKQKYWIDKLSTVFDIYTQWKNKVIFKFDKFDAEWENNFDYLNKYLWKYILISSKNDNILTSKQVFWKIDDIINIINTRPLFREVPEKYTWKKWVIAPTLDFYKLINGYKPEEKFKENIITLMDNIKTNYVYAIFSKQWYVYDIKVKNLEKMYKKWSKIDLKITKNWDFNSMIVTLTKDFKKIDFKLNQDYNQKITWYFKMDSNWKNSIDWTILWKVWQYYNLKIAWKNGNGTFSWNVNLNFDLDKIKIDFNYKWKSFYKNEELKFSINSNNNKLNILFDVINHVWKSKFNLNFDKNTGYTNIFLNSYVKSYYVNNSDFENQFTINWKGILKSWKSNFQLTWKFPNKWNLTLMLKDTSLSYNKYMEELKLEFMQNWIGFLKIDWKLNITKNWKRNIVLPTNYVKFDELGFVNKEQEQAKNTVKMINLHTIWTALSQYQFDTWEYPKSIYDNDELKKYIDYIPKDPDGKKYGYIVLYNGGTENAWYILYTELKNSNKCNFRYSDLEKIKTWKLNDVMDIKPKITKLWRKDKCLYVIIK